MQNVKIKDEGICFCLCCLIGAVIVFSSSAKQGAKDGMAICRDIIIPSLLPVLIIGGTITRSHLSRVFELLFGTIFKKVFKLQPACCSAVILGLVCGYPSGAVLTCSMYEKGVIDSQTAQRIMMFNFCAGAAFTVTAVGSVTYSNAKIGAFFYIINILSSLTVAFISGLFSSENKTYEQVHTEYGTLADSFCDATESTVKSLLMMSAYIILFSSFFALANPPRYLIPLLEITNGICSDTLLPPQYAVFFLAFGGLCVHVQLLGILRRMHVNYAAFLIGRISCAVLSFVYYKIFALAFPQSDTVFSNINAPAHSFSSGGVTLSMLMIIGCAVFVFDIENKKLKLPHDV